MILVFVPYHPDKQYALCHLFTWLAEAKLKDCDIIVRCDRGGYNADQAIKKQREYARLLAVDKGYSHLLFIDADTIPPLDTLPRLLAHDTPVVGALYYGRRQSSTGQPRVVAWVQDDDQQTFQYEPSPVPVDGMGLGCTLLDRDALTSFSFTDWEDPSDDFPMFDTLRKNGFTTLLDTTMVCKHYATQDKYT